jgi:hypothetical protein
MKHNARDSVFLDARCAAAPSTLFFVSAFRAANIERRICAA